MGTINPNDSSSKIPQSTPVTNVSSGESDASQAQQMDYILQWLEAFATPEAYGSYLWKEISQGMQDFSNFMKQSPIPLQKMEDELNQIVNDFNQQGWMGQLPNWDINATPQGKLMMQYMLIFAQELNGVSGGNTSMNHWVSEFGSYSGPWTPEALQSTLTEFTQDCAQAQIRIPPKNYYFHPPQVPSNLFT